MGEAFDGCVSCVLEKGQAECQFKCNRLGHSGKIYRCIREADMPVQTTSASALDVLLISIETNMDN